ncbi:hypothetical protein LXL04_005727 [Taraxacum kok-saghyz]
MNSHLGSSCSSLSTSFSYWARFFDPNLYLFFLRFLELDHMIKLITVYPFQFLYLFRLKTLCI